MLCGTERSSVDFGPEVLIQVLPGNLHSATATAGSRNSLDMGQSRCLCVMVWVVTLADWLSAMARRNSGPSSWIRS